MNTNKRTEIATLGKFGLIEHLTQGIAPANKETLTGTGDDAAVLAFDENEEVLLANRLFMEGIHFDLTYFPLEHLGYKVAMASFSNICNERHTQAVVSLACHKQKAVHRRP